MNTQKFTTVIIGLSIAVILVVGLMVPVINGAINDGGDEGYTNTGSYYYKNVAEGETHTIVVTVPPDPRDNPSTEIGVTTITLDGQTIASFDATEKFTLPLFVPVDYSSATIYGLIGNNSFLLRTNEAREAPEGSEVDPCITYGTADDEDYHGLELIPQGGRVEFQIDGSTVTTTVYKADHTVLTTGTMQIKAMITTDTTGDYVYAQSPIITEDTDIFFFGQNFKIDLRTETTRGEGVDTTYTSHGTIDQLSDNIVERQSDRQLSPFGTSGTPDYESWYWRDWLDSFEVSVDTEETADGLRLNKILLKETWGEDDGPQPKYVDCEFDRFLVPTHVGGSGGSSGLSDTMIAMISVIPLITVVGLVIGTIGFIRYRS